MLVCIHMCLTSGAIAKVLAFPYGSAYLGLVVWRDGGMMHSLNERETSKFSVVKSSKTINRGWFMLWFLYLGPS